MIVKVARQTLKVDVRDVVSLETRKEMAYYFLLKEDFIVFPRQDMSVLATG